jgi:hypothetical protein
MRRNAEAMMRAAERKDREVAAGRLNELVPNLRTLCLHIEERMPDRPGPEVVYIRHIVVDRAPALFDIPCCDRGCQGGGHDVTRLVIQALSRGTQHFEGSDRCSGSVRDRNCNFELKFVADATYG